MTAASAIALAAAFNSVDPRVHPAAGARNRHDSRLSAPDQYEALLGRRLAPTPEHLTSRILYVPSHNDKVTHLPVYEFTSEFKETVKDEPIGSSRFKTSFGLMHKPVGDGRDSSSVSYLVDFEPLEARRSVSGPGSGHMRKSSSGGVVTRASVQRRMLFGGGAKVGLTIPPHPVPGAEVEDVGAVAYTITPSSTTTDIPVATSFPLPPTISKFGSSRNTWFTFTIPSLLDDDKTLQWQVHPVEQGMLRYTLIELPKQGAPDSNSSHGQSVNGEKPPFSVTEEKHEKLIRAIYHNVGLGFSLSQPFSEGALLLQHDLEAEMEALIVASLLGLLWRTRNEESSPRRYSKSAISSKTMRKGSLDEGDVLSPAAGKKRILNKILGKK